MQQPPWYVARIENIVCILKKAIYGLKQSLKAWFEKFSRNETSLVLSDPRRYKCVAGMLIYQLVTHPNIFYAVGLLSLCMNQERFINKEGLKCCHMSKELWQKDFYIGSMVIWM